MSNIDNTIYRLNRDQEEQHTKARAQKLGMQYVDLLSYPLVKEILELIPEINAIQYELIPYLKISKELRVGITSPENQEVLDFIKDSENTLGLKISPSLISRSSFYYGISVYERFKKEKAEKLEEKKASDKEVTQIEISDIKSAALLTKQANITRLFDIILYSAYKLNASDIHLEPLKDNFLIRFRVDGVLQDVVELPIAKYKQLLSRIKYLAKLRIDLTDQPQDGRFTFSEIGDMNIDFRVSLMPSAYGESIVLRLLGQEKSILNLDKLGFRSDALNSIKNAISRPHGMVLTSGPTGSGKTSTLYAILHELNTPETKIITLEDPIEYKIEGVEQSQMKPESGYTFASGLRASLRQDPDVLMVGEIRDQETAEIAVQSALTGHLLLSTIHANSAPAVFARLLEIGVKPFLLTGSINIIMAQRLVRKNCPYCQKEYSLDKESWEGVKRVLASLKPRLKESFAKKLDQSEIKLIKSEGCPKCNLTGFSGREVIIEYLVPDETIEKLISKGASILEFEKTAAQKGMITMEQDGLIKALLGSTTVEEVWRVTRS